MNRFSAGRLTVLRERFLVFILTAVNAENAEMKEKERLDSITGTIINSAIGVHRVLGPGLLESAYEACLQLASIHKAQLLSYLRLSECKVGLLINFNVKVLKDGIIRMVNNFPDSQRSLRPPR